LGVGECFGVGDGFGDGVAEGVGEAFSEDEGFGDGGGAGFLDDDDEGFGDGDGDGDGAAGTLQSGRQSARLKTKECNFMDGRTRFPAA